MSETMLLLNCLLLVVHNGDRCSQCSGVLLFFRKAFTRFDFTGDTR